jgi:hypothetical protein
MNTLEECIPAASLTVSKLAEGFDMDKKRPPVIIGVMKTAFAALLLLLTAGAGAQNSKIKCYFNRPVNTGVSTGVNAVYLNTTFVDTAVAYINRSKYSLDICVYNYTYNSGDGLDAIATAVNSAYNRGVAVRWIYDGSSTNSGLALLNAGIATLGSPTGFSYGIMHNKFMVIDANSTNLADPVVFTGSFNFSRAQSDVDYNNIIVFQDKPLAQAFYAEFNKMWGGTGATPNLSASRFGPFKTASAQTSFTVNGTPVEVYFSPMDPSGTQLQNAINTVNSDLFFGIYTFTDTSIANLIKARKNAGFSVRGIMDSYSQGFTPYTTLSAALGSNLRVYSSSGTYHNKIMLVDAAVAGSDPQVFTGSFNWSISAQTKNDENSVVVHDAVVANQYYQSLCRNFTDLGGSACPLVGIDEFDLGPLEAVVYPNPASSALTVKIKNAGARLSARIVDLAGRELLSVSDVSDELLLDITPLQAGLYFVEMMRGDRSFSARFVKQ